MAVVIYFSYAIQCYVPMEVITRMLKKRQSNKFENVIQVSIRTFIVIVSGKSMKTSHLISLFYYYYSNLAWVDAPLLGKGLPHALHSSWSRAEANFEEQIQLVSPSSSGPTSSLPSVPGLQLDSTRQQVILILDGRSSFLFLLICFMGSKTWLFINGYKSRLTLLKDNSVYQRCQPR